MKYIMLSCVKGDLERKVPIIFPDFLTHSCMLLAVRESEDFEVYDSVNAVSAGEVSSMDLEVTCTGRSSTLQLDANPEDSAIIRNYDYMHGL